MEHISNETKAREIAMTNCRCEGCFAIDTIDDCFHSALQAMRWKDEQHEQQKQQLIDKAADFISKHFYIGINNQITSKGNYNTLTELIRDLEQSIKGE